MTASTRFWKRHNAATTAPITLSTSCAFEPPRDEPIQIRLRADDDGPLAGAHFIITMTAKEATPLITTLMSYVTKLGAVNAVVQG